MLLLIVYQFQNIVNGNGMEECLHAIAYYYCNIKCILVLFFSYCNVISTIECD